MKKCHHDNPTFIEIDGREAMFQCLECGEIWWENIRDREGREKFLAENIPPPKEVDEDWCTIGRK